MSNGITLEVHDWHKDGTRRPFFGNGDRGYFWLHLYYASGVQASLSGSIEHYFMKEDETTKATSKMNVAIRGNDGKFISYRKLQNTDHEHVFEGIDALPNI